MKAEPYLLRALNIDESLYGRDGLNLLMPLASVCALYDKWGISTLANEAKTLRSLGRVKEAADVEDGLASIRSLTMQTH